MAICEKRRSQKMILFRSLFFKFEIAATSYYILEALTLIWGNEESMQKHNDSHTFKQIPDRGILNHIFASLDVMRQQTKLINPHMQTHQSC